MKYLSFLFDKLTQVAEIKVLTDPLLKLSIAQIDQSQSNIKQLIQYKQMIQYQLIDKYENDLFTANDIRLIIDSFNDNHSYLQDNMLPIDYLLTLLKQYFGRGKQKSSSNKA